MKEVWKSLNGILKSQGENFMISNLGNIRNIKTGTDRKLTNHKTGYLMITIDRSTYRVHALVAKAFIPNPDNKPIVNHKDGDKKNNVVTNLEWVTYAENVQHAFDTELYVPSRGDNHYESKLTEDNVREIKRMLMEGAKSRAAAEKFGVSKMIISCIKNGRTWKHVHVEGFSPSKY